VPTLVCFHAHPDDESLTTGGTMAMAADAGNRVVLVIATGGEYGEVPDDLAPGETLAQRRRTETERSAAELGVARVVWLGYVDSGMTGWAQNEEPSSFLQADVEEAAQRLAAVLDEEKADVVTIYDWHGNYGHPDHVKVHSVGGRAAEIAGTPYVYEATINRDAMERGAELMRQSGADLDETQTDDGNPFGMPEADLTTAIDVLSVIGRKRASLASHASQVTDSGFFLSMPLDVFAQVMGTEWFIRRGVPGGITESWLAGLLPAK
jgi:LmbE family N-acetylglucosaminyl deacetylase